MSFRCQSCSAPLEPEMADGALVTCGYCRVVGPSPFPKLDVLAVFDPARGRSTGFTVHAGTPALGPDATPELSVDVAGKSGAIQHALTSQSTFDDCEVTLETRLLFGDQTTTYVSLFLRKSASAYYALDLSTSATIRLSVRTGPSLPELRELVGWSARDAIRREPGAVNQLRVRFEGDRIEVRVNDQHALAARDATHRAGTIVVGSHSAVRHGYAIRSLRVHGVHAAAPAAHRSTEAPRATGTVGTRLVQHGGALHFRHADAHNGVAVVLDDCGKQKISCIKAVREITNWSLRDAKNGAEQTPTLLGYAVDRGEAHKWVAHLAATGAAAHVG